jgi:hypothetical protein
LNLPLFDPPLGANPLSADFRASFEVRKQEERSGILRIIEPKAGPHREVKNGQATGREFQILELQDGTFVWRFTDNGERVTPPAGCSRTLLEDLLRANVFVEVLACA